jgi:hypothetical protein
MRKTISLPNNASVLTLHDLRELVTLAIAEHGENARVALPLNGPRFGEIRDIRAIVPAVEKKLSKRETYRRVVLDLEEEGLRDILTVR